MRMRRGAFKTYIIWLACIYNTFITSEGLQGQSGGAFIEENGQSTSQFFYQHTEYPRDCRDVRNHCSTSEGMSSGTYLVKPEGYSEPFEVYCNNNIDSGGWTVVLRRSDGSLSFKRNWDDYQFGFGFPSNEHWIGNEKLSYLTNQAQNELRIDFVLSNESSFYVKYNAFRVSDEWSQFELVSSGIHGGNASLTICPPYMVYKNITCQLTCEDPRGSKSCGNSESVEYEACACADGLLRKGVYCVRPSQCGCFLAEANVVIPNNETYVNTDCSEKCSCQNDRLTCHSNYECSPNAVCGIKDNVRQCYCNERYQGDGETCTQLYKDCYDAFIDDKRQNGVYTILPAGWPRSPFDVYCDMTTSGGGWTVFLRRVDGVTDFYRNWTSYKNGFGSVQHGNDFWLGNEQLHYITSTNRRSYKLRIDIVSSGGAPKYQEYASFRTDNEGTKYRLVDLGGHSGNGGDGMHLTIGRQFSTYDDDNDVCGNHNCAEKHRGAWWYNNYRCSYCFGTFCCNFQYSSSCHTHCTESNLNGDYNGVNGENIFWDDKREYCNLNSAEMKIRPVL